jgi:hypothetical protein
MFHFLSFFLEFSLFYLMIAQSNHAVVVCYHIRAKTTSNPPSTIRGRALDPNRLNCFALKMFQL